MAHVMDGPRTPFPLRLCLALCGLMVSVPFLLPYHYFPFPTFYTEWFAFAGALAAASGFFQLYHTPLPTGVTVVQQPSSFMFGVIGQSNNFANYLGAALLSVAFLHSRNVLGTAAALLMALLMATGMALSG